MEAQEGDGSEVRSFISKIKELITQKDEIGKPGRSFCSISSDFKTQKWIFSNINSR